ncbi:NAD(P)/FAD-dependent oxidoreductase [Cellulosimicrobium protaetiae]|uniref:FAD-dependent oxidoreductase n=1 Tax=Cellulosimicrobium protaetiae TaxID=2587808 RepID=A0A6M5UG04_9MICO|nr:NAD(P)/FAD-dependent oxidoreductase [Cellulosimicrobium protaetiae]QJW37476.1 FAD-dependent oxidoreductase [Cellulosimicrobium protaetiae]
MSSAEPPVLPPPPAHRAAPPTGVPGPPASVVVVGAGLAGAQTVGALRRRGYAGRVTVLGAEGVPPYDRPPLSKELLSRPSPAWLADDLGVDVEDLADEVRLQDPAVQLVRRRASDGGAWEVTTASGDRLTADSVVLAVGSAPVRPDGWEQATLLHTAQDAAALRAALHPGLRLVIVGAGWIGAELAGVAVRAGAHVTVLEAADAPLRRQLGPVVGAHLSPWYAAVGAELVTGVAVAQVRPDGVRLADGRELSADLVLAAVGARPATDWLDGAVPRDPRGSIPVDTTGAVPGLDGLWAVGDCATREHPLLGAVPGGHWSAALHDPDATVAALLGDDEVGTGHAPYVFSQQLGHDLALFGVPAEGDIVLFRGDPTGGATGHDGWAAFYLAPGAHSGSTSGDGTTADGSPAADGGPEHRSIEVRAVLLVDSPRDVGPVRKAMNRTGRLRVNLDAALDPTRRLRDALA